MPTFKLINPTVIGEIVTEFTCENGKQAAQQFWNELGPKLAASVPMYYITLQEGGTNNLYHYKITEKLDNKTANYTINEHKVKMSAKDSKNLISLSQKTIKSTNKIINKQTGGDDDKKKHDDKIIKKPRKHSSSSSCSSSDSECEYFDFRRFRHITNPINYWWYNPYVYNVRSIYNPVFLSPYSPYVEIWIPL